VSLGKWKISAKMMKKPDPHTMFGGEKNETDIWITEEATMRIGW
jgi:hypothetical protein